MRNDNCYIDGVSTLNRFGAWVLKGGYKDLLSFPGLVEPEKNDWAEEDGIEVDLSSPKLQSKEITIPFLSKKGGEDLIVFLSAPGYHTLYIPILQREWNIRLVGQTYNRILSGLEEFSLKFTQDAPTRPALALPDPGVFIHDSGYELDNVSFADYGVVVERAKDDIFKAADVKKNLSRKISTSDGVIYDVEHLVFSSKEVTFKCYFKAVSISAFWSCYDSFFGALIQPGERKLYIPAVGRTIPCYYKKSDVFKIVSLHNNIIVQFNLTLVFTVFRLNGTIYFLSSENGSFIITENEDCKIDLNHVG